MKDKLFLIINEDKTIQEFQLQKILNNLSNIEDSKIVIDLSVSSFTDLLDEASIMSMFSSEKIIVAINGNLDKINDYELEYLEKYLGNPNEYSYIIILTNKVDTRKKYYKIIKNYFTIIDEGEFNKNKINEYVINVLRDKKYQMNDIDVFVDRVGNNINNINTELDKLMIYKEKSKIITLEDINLLISENIENIMYEFTNAFFDRDYSKLVTMYDKFKRDNIGIDYIISSLAGSIRTSIIIKLLKNDGKSNLEISKYIGKKEFFVKKSLERLYQYSLNDLIDMQKELADIDKNIKNGKSNIDELEFYILKK